METNSFVIFCILIPEKINKLKAEKELERANGAFASLDSDQSGRYDGTA